MGAAYGQISPCTLPPQMDRSIREHWKGWRAMQLSDLNPDDQRLWVGHWGKLCPGIANGHFFDLHNIDYAISLINPENHEQAIVIAKSNTNGKYSIRVISPPEAVPNFAVIHTLPPGTYKGVENGPRVTTKLDSIAVEQIEAGMMMFYEKHGSFHSLELSE